MTAPGSQTPTVISDERARENAHEFFVTRFSGRAPRFASQFIEDGRIERRFAEWAALTWHSKLVRDLAAYVAHHGTRGPIAGWGGEN